MKAVNLLIIQILILSLVSLNSCTEGNEPVYVVWTETVTYDDYSDVFGTLSDGYYIRRELSDSEFEKIKPSLTNEEKRRWTEEQLNSWFIGRGFGSTEAIKERSWLVTIKHGFIASRSGNIVYVLWK
jgi:hypothetical protein